jgi:hypothetical protein
VRVATLALTCCVLAACNDVRDFQGTWHGPRVGDAPVLRVGIAQNATATLSIDQIDTHGFQGSLSIDGLVTSAFIQSVPSAEADVLAGMTWAGSPLRIYLGFFAVPDKQGDALAMIALYDDHRVEIRVLRGGTSPLYGIFTLAEGT